MIYTEKVKAPKYKSDGGNATLVNVKLKGIRVTYNKLTDQLTFFDGKGKKILEEVASTGRELSNSQLADGNIKWSDVSQSFVSPTDEFLFGTGQFTGQEKPPQDIGQFQDKPYGIKLQQPL